MSSTHRKGYQFKYDVRRFLASWGIITRDSGTGTAGDDLSTPFLSIECKNAKSITLAAFMDQCTGNANGKLPVLVVKRRGWPVGKAYAVLELEHLIRLLPRS